MLAGESLYLPCPNSECHIETENTSYEWFKYHERAEQIEQIGTEESKRIHYHLSELYILWLTPNDTGRYITRWWSHTLPFTLNAPALKEKFKLYSRFIPESSSNSGVCRPVGGMRRTNVMNMKLTLWFMRSSTKISFTQLRKKKRHHNSTVQCVRTVNICRPRSSGIRYCMMSLMFVVNVTAC